MALVPGNEIRQKKEQLKAQGLSGKKCDQDPEAPRHALSSIRRGFDVGPGLGGSI